MCLCVCVCVFFSGCDLDVDNPQVLHSALTRHNQSLSPAFQNTIALTYSSYHNRIYEITENRVNLEVDVLAKYVERSMGATIEALRGEIKTLQDKVSKLEAGGAR